MSNLQYFILTVILFTFSCKPAENITETTIPQNGIREHSVLAVLWQQHAAEYRALSYQAFNLARLQLDRILNESQEGHKPIAIVTDIDETALDNSPYNGKQIELDEDYTQSRWIEWGERKSATPVPGALEFFQYAASQGVSIFYISNRYNAQKSVTIENLKNLDFPFADDEHVLLKTTISGKEPRRQQVEDSHDIVMLLGDNLSDFSIVFDSKPTTKRNSLVDQLRNEFGVKYIVLPNPVYGDWETKGIYEGKYDWTLSQKDSIRRAKVVTY